MGINGSLMVANDVSIPRECFDKISEFMKRNWLRAAHFLFTMGFVMAKISKNLKSSVWTLKLAYMSSYVTHIWRRTKLNQSVL